MRNKLIMIISVFFILAFAVSLNPVLAQYNSSTNPTSIGAPVRSMIELGSVYSNIYDITITVLETIRGKEAMDSLKTASPENSTPPKGFEYILVRVRFEMKGRAVTDTLTFNLGNAPLQWVCLASDLTEYPQVSVKVPKPALVGRVKPGDSMEGWVAFAVDREDSKPVMVFDPDSGGATGRGRTLFFELYR
jgi:hypothetical protein